MKIGLWFEGVDSRGWLTVSPVRREGLLGIDKKPKTTNGFQLRPWRDAVRDATRPAGLLRENETEPVPPTCLSVPPLGQITSTSSQPSPPPLTSPLINSTDHLIVLERERERERPGDLRWRVMSDM